MTTTAPPPNADARLAAIAENQHGLITAGQALVAGLTDQGIAHRLRSGRWHRVHNGVYRIAGQPRSFQQELTAARLATGPDAAISHRPAAASQGVRLPEPAPVEISVARHRAPRRAGVIVHRSRDLTPDQLVVVDGLVVTGPTRTLVDLGQVVPWWVVDRALEHFLATKAVTVPQVRAALAHHSRHGRDGCGALRRVLEARGLGDVSPEGVTEELLARVVRDAGLPLPVHQHEVVLAGTRRRIDFAYPELRIAIEVDGYEFHAAPSQFELDRARGNDLVLAGWTVLRFTFLQLVHRPGWVVAQIARALSPASTASGH